jgi:hypothetical protein
MIRRAGELAGPASRNVVISIATAIESTSAGGLQFVAFRV